MSGVRNVSFIDICLHSVSPLPPALNYTLSSRDCHFHLITTKKFHENRTLRDWKRAAPAATIILLAKPSLICAKTSNENVCQNPNFLFLPTAFHQKSIPGKYSGNQYLILHVPLLIALYEIHYYTPKHLNEMYPKVQRSSPQFSSHPEDNTNHQIPAFSKNNSQQS